MNAYQIMSFLLLFNISLSVVLSLGIYSDMSQPGQFNIEGSDEFEGQFEDLGIKDEKLNMTIDELKYKQRADLLSIFGGNILIALVAGIALGGSLSFITQVPGDAVFAYSMFISFYWSMAKNTIDVLYTLAGEAGEGLLYVVIIFVIILSISFLSFMIQLVRGPWESFQ